MWNVVEAETMYIIIGDNLPLRDNKSATCRKLYLRHDLAQLNVSSFLDLAYYSALGSCCCQFCSSGSDREHDGVTTVAAVMGKGVMWEASWNHTHLYAPSLNCCCYLCCSCSCLLGGICSRCRLNSPAPSCCGLCGQWCQ